MDPDIGAGFDQVRARAAEEEGAVFDFGVGSLEAVAAGG